ncbi:MAG: hypothetical protein ABIN18_01325 [Pseudomonadota bacterium]
MKNTSLRSATVFWEDVHSANPHLIFCEEILAGRVGLVVFGTFKGYNLWQKT